jgi:hypothetical protein
VTAVGLLLALAGLGLVYGAAVKGLTLGAMLTKIETLVKGKGGGTG